MTETKDFPTADVLSTITGYLMSEDIGGVYLVCNWMTGESVFTHQLPRIGREAQAFMVRLRPDLLEAVTEAANVNRENWRRWLAIWIERYGPTISVPKFDAADHERIDPLSELAEKVHPSKIIVVNK
jgi:hypothetical protein